MTPERAQAIYEWAVFHDLDPWEQICLQAEYDTRRRVASVSWWRALASDLGALWRTFKEGR